MVAKAVAIIDNAFWACIGWLDVILDSVQGKGILISAILIVFVTSLFLMPLRGGSVSINSALIDFAGHAMYKGKFSKGAKRPKYSKMGKFEKGNHKARTDRNARLRTM